MSGPSSAGKAFPSFDVALLCIGLQCLLNSAITSTKNWTIVALAVAVAGAVASPTCRLQARRRGRGSSERALSTARSWLPCTTEMHSLVQKAPRHCASNLLAERSTSLARTLEFGTCTKRLCLHPTSACHADRRLEGVARAFLPQQRRAETIHPSRTLCARARPCRKRARGIRCFLVDAPRKKQN